MFETNQLPGRTAIFKGQEWLYFSGTAYLGVNNHVQFRNLVAEGLTQYGSHYGGSRLASIQLSIFKDAEQFLSQWTQLEAGIVLSSGSVAGQLVTKYFSEVGMPFFTINSHPASHPTLPQNISRFRLDPIQALPTNKTVAIFSDAINALRASPIDFDFLHQLPSNRTYYLVLDESHSLGTCGKHGAGYLSLLELPDNIEPIIISSLGKAFGIPGGIILGKQKTLHQFWRHPFFGGASPASPAFLHALVNAKSLYLSQWEQLMDNCALFETQFPSFQKYFQSFSGFPVYYTTDQNLAGFLNKHQVFISSFPYPTTEDPILNRIVLNAQHTTSDIRQLTHLLRTYFMES